MKQKTKEVYYCDFCDKHSLQKNTMLRHINTCVKNPDNFRKCFTCKNLTNKEAETEIKLSVGNISKIIKHKVELLYCSEKCIFIHTPVNEKKGKLYVIVGEVNHPMPIKCKKYELVDNTQI